MLVHALIVLEPNQPLLMRLKLQKCIRVLPWLLLLIIGCYLALGEGWKDVTLGRFHRKAQEMFADVGGVTEARVYLLMGTKEQRTKETSTKKVISGSSLI